MKVKGLCDWNIVKIIDTGDIGIIRNDCLPEGMKRHVCVQFLDRTAVVIDADSQVELIKAMSDCVYNELKRVTA